MSDYKDIFDELIDDDSENDTNYFDDDDDEDSFTTIDLRTAVMTKGEMIALITLRTTDKGAQITRYDPRESVPTARQYEDATEASRWFRRSVSTSLRNGWNIVYNGEPMFG
jgi:hypothetical protein